VEEMESDQVSPATARSVSPNRLDFSQKSWMSDAVLHSAGVCSEVVTPDGAEHHRHVTGVPGSRLSPPHQNM